MIFFFVTKRHSYTLQGLAHQEHPVRKYFKNIYYEEFLHRPNAKLLPGVYIFTDFDRLSYQQCFRMAKARKNLVETYGDKVIVLNHPTLSMRRFEFLRTLYEAGINRYNAYPLVGNIEPKWPAFVRIADDHQNNTPRILNNASELTELREELQQLEFPRESQLVIESIDTADADGIYRKYSAFKIGDRILPRHVFFSKKWFVKKKDLLDERFVAEEVDYFNQFPHKAEIDEIFNIAQMQYGRIDYSLLDGQIQVWEINSNPNIPVRSQDDPPAREEINSAFIQRYFGQFESLLSSIS